jgi:ribosomal-protein-alanine N-acetyltransferase
VNSKVTLVPIGQNGTIQGYTGSLPDAASQALLATAKLYDTVGFEEPWICYLALAEDLPVGTCGFKSAPCNGRVEIAYFTFPECEGRGYATAMAAALVAIVRQHKPSLVISAQTLPKGNASHKILEKLGFRHVDTINHPEDGIVWEWQLNNDIRA